MNDDITTLFALLDGLSVDDEDYCSIWKLYMRYKNIFQ